jgi:hypothetical protein
MPKRASRDAVPDFLAVEEAAMVLRVGRSCAYDQAREFMATHGESGLPVVRIGRLLRVPRAALEQMAGGPISWPIDNETASIAPVTPVISRPPASRKHSRPTGQRSLQFPA